MWSILYTIFHSVYPIFHILYSIAWVPKGRFHGRKRKVLYKLLENLFFNFLVYIVHPGPLLYDNFPEMVPSDICFLASWFLTVISMDPVYKTCCNMDSNGIVHTSLCTRAFILAVPLKSLFLIKKHLQAL